MCDYANAAKAVAEKQYHADQQTSGMAAGIGIAQGRPVERMSPLAEMEQRRDLLRAEGDGLIEGIVFLRDNPQINEFIRLVRKGAISI